VFFSAKEGDFPKNAFLGQKRNIDFANSRDSVLKLVSGAKGELISFILELQGREKFIYLKTSQLSCRIGS